MSAPWFVNLEAVANGEAADIKAGARDLTFYRDGWSAPHADGAVTARVSTRQRASVHFPLPRRRDYEVVLRLDPVEPGAQRRLSILLNDQMLGTLPFAWNPERVGSYRLTLPARYVRSGENELEVVPDTMVTAARAGPRFAWMDPGEQIGVRFWYLRVLD
jgi:hypothetical protein